jgi:hypothetical protein
MNPLKFASPFRRELQFLALLLSMAPFVLGSSTARAQIFASGTGYTNSVTPVSGSPWSYGTESDLTGAHTTPYDTNYYYTVDNPSYNGIGTPTYPPGDSTTLIGLGNFANDSRVQYDPHATPIVAGTLTLPPLTVTLRQDQGSTVLDPYMRFTAGDGGPASAGTLALAVSFGPSDTGFNAGSYSETFSIILNNRSGTHTLFTDLLTGDGTSTPFVPLTFADTLTLASGDTVDFVESGAFGNPASTSNLSVTFSAVVPEPATWAFLVTGVLVLGLASLRKRDSASRNV